MHMKKGLLINKGQCFALALVSFQYILDQKSLHGNTQAEAGPQVWGLAPTVSSNIEKAQDFSHKNPEMGIFLKKR